MSSAPLSYGLLAGLAIALLAAAAGDLHHRRIANRLNAAIALAAPLWWWASGLSGVAVLWQVELAAGCLFVFAALFAGGLLGGGDVKLLTALALWIRPAWFAQLLAVMALTGGAVALACLLARWLGPKAPRRGVPYGVAIASGALWVLAADYAPALALSRVAGG